MLTVGGFRGLFLSLCLMVILARCLFAGAALHVSPYKVKGATLSIFQPSAVMVKLVVIDRYNYHKKKLDASPESHLYR